MLVTERDWDIFKTHPITSEPYIQFKKLLMQAQRSMNTWVHNFVLGTIDPDSWPSSRVVSLHSFDERGFIFCTNNCAPKAKAIESNNKVSMVFQWEPIRTQVRITGTATQQNRDATITLFNRCSKPEKLYYISCSQGSDHSWSQSSILLPNGYDWKTWKSELVTQYGSVDESQLPLPDSWSSYLIEPQTIEILNLMLCAGGRMKWTKLGNGEWKKELLSL